MNIDHYRAATARTRAGTGECLGEEVETAREAGDDQRAASDFAQVDQPKEDSLALAETDSAILAAVRAALRRIEDGTYGLTHRMRLQRTQ